MKQTMLLAIPVFLIFCSCNQSNKKIDNSLNLQSLVDAENNFAELAKKTNVKNAFLQNLDEHSITFSKGEVITHSIDSIHQWKVSDSDYLFWWVLVADISASGEMGYTTGACEWGKWEAPNKSNLKINGGGYYASVWQKDKNGQWKVAADLGAGVLDPNDKNRSWIKEEKIHFLPSKNIDMESEKMNILDYDKKYNDKLNSERKSFITAFLSPKARLHRSGEKPFDIPEKIQANIDIEKNVLFSFEQAGGNIAKSADMAYTYGNASFELTQDGKEHKVQTNYLRVWKWENDEWKIVLDVIQ